VKKNHALLLVLMLVFALSRWPGLMPGNFSAAYAIFFCAGLYFSDWRTLLAVVGTMLGVDLFISKFGYHNYEFSWRDFLVTMAPNYVAYVLLIFLGRGLGKKRSWLTLVGGGIVGAFLFYIVTNIGAWITLPYAKTLQGLIQALTVGLPGFPHTWEFFLNTLLSGGLFTGLFVGAAKMASTAESAEEKREPVPAPEQEPGEEPSGA